jgi:hypothetical protein
MGWEKYLMAIIAIGLVTISISLATAVTEISEVNNLISSLEKPDISSLDMAAFLTAHGFDAVAKNGYTELELMGKIYMITPSIKRPGSYDTELVILQCPNTKMYEEDLVYLKS